MSTEATSGAKPEQQSPPMAEAGCEDKIDRSVLGTGRRTGFAELRARAIYWKHDAEQQLAGHTSLDQDGPAEYERGKIVTLESVIRWIDELSGCEGCKHVGVMDNDFNGPSS